MRGIERGRSTPFLWTRRDESGRLLMLHHPGGGDGATEADQFLDFLEIGGKVAREDRLVMSDAISQSPDLVEISVNPLTQRLDRLRSV